MGRPPLNKNLTSGSHSRKGLEISLASADDICKIIKAAASSQLREIRVPGLYMSFGSPNHKEADRPEANPTISSLAQDSEEIERDVAKEEATNHLVDDLDHLRLTDPLAYEKFVEGELGGAPS